MVISCDLYTNEITDTIIESSLHILSDEQIRSLSVLSITSPKTLTSQRIPVPGGLMDPLLGNTIADRNCTSCTLQSDLCPGHLGHIEIPYPLLRPYYTGDIEILLNLICVNCFHPRVTKTFSNNFSAGLSDIELQPVET